MPKKWYQKASVQTAVISGIFLIIAAVVAGIFDMYQGISTKKNEDGFSQTIDNQERTQPIMPRKTEEHHLNWKKGPRVFISYSSRDRSFVGKLVADLTSSKLKFWIDQNEIDIGDSIPRHISEGLNWCDVFLIILSHSSVNSKWVQRELDSAIMREVDREDLIIIPALVSDCDIPPLLQAKRYADFRRSYSSGLLQLLDALNEGMAKQKRCNLGKVANIEASDTTIAESDIWKRLPGEDAFAGITPTKENDGTIILASKGVRTVRVMVVFQSTGEHFYVRLPEDLKCEIAARRIVGEIFLKDLPTQRRDAYLQRGDFYLAKLGDNSGTTNGSKTPLRFMGSYTDRPGFWSETLREAGISNGTEIIVLTAIPYPWAHNVAMASELAMIREESLSNDFPFRITEYIKGMINNRLNKRSLTIY